MWKKVVQKLKLNRDDATLESERREVKDRGQESLTSSRSAPELINNNVNLNAKVDTELLTKKGSLIKKKQNSQEVEVEENAEPGEIDPVYSLLKCAADLPKASKPSCGIHAQCSGHHSSASTKGESSSTSTSKTTSPASSGPADPSLGGDFKNYYKQTCPVIKKQSSSPFIIPF
uniref:Uncharacterized protein n=1 Tax=Magallana gigas TaxID=29159 RepID=A0A8W8N3G6_MAGGI